MAHVQNIESSVVTKEQFLAVFAHMLATVEKEELLAPAAPSPMDMRPPGLEVAVAQSAQTSWNLEANIFVPQMDAMAKVFAPQMDAMAKVFVPQMDAMAKVFVPQRETHDAYCFERAPIAPLAPTVRQRLLEDTFARTKNNSTSVSEPTSAGASVRSSSYSGSVGSCSDCGDESDDECVPDAFNPVFISTQSEQINFPLPAKISHPRSKQFIGKSIVRSGRTLQPRSSSLGR